MRKSFNNIVSFPDGNNYSNGEDDLDDAYRSSNLIVNYLPANFDEYALQKLFEKYGKIADRKIIRDRATRKSLGYGFVRFSSDEEATLAICHLNGIKIDKKIIKVSYARPSSEDIKDCKLFATNFPSYFNETECRKLFSEFGRIIELRYVDKPSPDGKSNAMAFVQFDIRAQAVRAKMKLHNALIPGGEKRLVVRFTESTKSSSGSTTSSVDSMAMSYSSVNASAVHTVSAVQEPVATVAVLDNYDNIVDDSFDESKVRDSSGDVAMLHLQEMYTPMSTPVFASTPISPMSPMFVPMFYPTQMHLSSYAYPKVAYRTTYNQYPTGYAPGSHQTYRVRQQQTHASASGGGRYSVLQDDVETTKK